LIFSSSQSRPTAKLCDLGFCTDVKLAVTFVGTQGYVAPEILEGAVYGTPADIYSLGVTLRFLFQGTLNTGIQNLVRRCMNQDPARRPSIRAVSLKLTAWIVERQ
jgi:serine/threonine protein kinase